MERLPPNYLSKKGGQWRPVKLMDLVTFIYNVSQGTREDSVGFEDAARTVDMLLKELNKSVMLDPALLESAFWSCGMMQEAGKFWDTKNRTYDEFIKDVLGKDKLHRVYHTIEKE